MHEVEVPRAEAFSFWTHAVSAVAAIAVLVVLVIRAEGPLAVTAVAVYGATLVLLFSSSSFHHVVGSMGPKWHAISRRLDHIAIFLLIAGTYTPFTLVALPPGWGWSIFGVVWAFAVAGTLLKIFNPHTPRWITVGIYLIMGWIALVAVVPMWTVVPRNVAIWLLAGGVIYSVGAVIYARKRPDPLPDHVGFHGVWHVFVMAAAAAHVVAVWNVL